MPPYKLIWITEHLASGPAPMSYDELGSIREQGIDAIMNLCKEYCDLHQIEKDYGFDVFYFPIVDDEAPALEEMDKALEWLDESVYLGKKVLVHCRLGIGRTGTFITAYLLRRGFGLKLAQKRLKRIGSNPTSFRQWRLLRKYGKISGKLTIRDPSLEGSRAVDLNLYFSEYESVMLESDKRIESVRSAGHDVPECGQNTDACCGRFLYVQLIEAAYLNYHLNKNLTREDRLAAIDRAYRAGKEYNRKLYGTVNMPIQTSPLPHERNDSGKTQGEQQRSFYVCPLNVSGKCMVFAFRPLACRTFGVPEASSGKTRGLGEAGGREPGIVSPPVFNSELSKEALYLISRRLFYALNGTFLEGKSLLFPLTDVVSGKFVQDYFFLLTGMKNR